MCNIQISFCIPTYNRSELLSELIKSIVEQCNNRADIEICISDNASSDDTSEMIKDWTTRTHLPIIYKRNEINLGADKNILLAQTLASGKYCWFFGSDDKLFPGSIDYLDSFIEKNNDIYLVERTEFNFNFSTITRPGRKWMSTDSCLYDTSNKVELYNYLSNSISIGAVFSFLSSLIVKRERWNKIDFDEKYIGSAYPHVYVLLSILNQGAIINYINKPLIMYRGDNDHFSQNGVVSRIELDLKGYLQFSDEFYNYDIELKSKFDQILLQERPYLKTIAVISTRGTKEEKLRMKKYYMKLGKNGFFINLIYFLKPLLFLAKKIISKL
ncbi:glycosyltransferase family 2 protein [Yersinia enterocolitica]|uniref:glycosyltransferase family 2 protein n=1 Tax=Yersinia enterocolitica TaxID=630 RepID=UPI00065A83BA|nr:glycosyltransferase family 2 protein [Yersinia enterocolitica]CRY23052.1 putative glycosyltransferase [Yersinia enterocolitica]